MNKKVPMWLFLITLVFALTGFGLWGKSNLNHFDREYGLHAEEFYSKSRILDLLEKGNIENAKQMLKEETESIGVAVTMCLMNDCSSRAKEVRDKYARLGVTNAPKP